MHIDNIIEKLKGIYHEQKLAHAYLFETNDVEQLSKDLMDLVKYIMCPKNNYQNECNACNICHLIENNSLPSFIIIEPIEKTINKESITYLKDKFSKKSQYTSSNVYMIKYPEKMNATSFNKLLKFLEEPEENIYGFLITENASKVANTIVSRCEVIKILYKNEVNEIDENIKQIANKYIEIITNAPKEIFWYNITQLSPTLDSTTVPIFLKIIFLHYKEQIFKEKNALIKLNILKKYLNEANYNINIDLMLNSLSIELGDQNENL